MTQHQFQELNNSIKNLPAQQLARKMGNTNLNALRKSLYELDIHEDLLSVLGRKYFPEKWHKKHELSVSEFMEEQDLPQQIASVVRKALHLAGTPTTTRVKKLVKNQDRDELFEPAVVQPGRPKDENFKAEPTENNGDMTSQGQGRGSPTIGVQLTLTGYKKNDVTDKESTLSQYVDALKQGNMTETDLLNIFGVNENNLRNILTPMTKNILELFYFINYGNTLENSKDFTLLNKLLESENVGKLWNEDDLTLEAMLRMLVLIVDHFQNHKFFFCNNIVRIPYIFNDQQNFNINFNASEKTFELLNKFPIQLDGFCSIKFDLEFSFLIEQLIHFEVNSAFEGLSADIQLNAPPIYRQTCLVLHNLCKNEIKIMEQSIIGKFVSAIKMYFCTYFCR